MFLIYWFIGLVRIVCWRCGWHVEGIAPSFKTAYSVFGWTGRYVKKV